MAMDEMMGGEMMGEGMSPSAPPMEPSETDAGNERASIFLSQDQLGGRKVKAGDSLTLVVRDVDPESGDVQADLSEGGETSPEAAGGYASDFDNAMPEEA